MKAALLTGHRYGKLAAILLENSGSQHRRCFRVFPADYEGAGIHTYQLPSVLRGAGAGANALVLPLCLVWALRAPVASENPQAQVTDARS